MKIVDFLARIWHSGVESTLYITAGAQVIVLDPKGRRFTPREVTVQEDGDTTALVIQLEER